MRLQAYLDRIGFPGTPRADLESLTALHAAHLLAIPYDALDVQFVRPVSTDPEAAYDKIVGQGRGGWCYEMNGLFGWALGEIGFQVTRLAAHGSAPCSHLALRVDLDRPYIADVGFGDGPFAPFAMAPGAFEQRGFGFLLEESEAGWKLNNHPYGMAKFYDCGGPDEAGMAQTAIWLSSDPTSPFVLNAVAARHVPDGIDSLVGRVLREVRPHGVVTTRIVEDAAEYVATLKSRFGVDLPEAGDLWPAICARHDVVMEERRKAKPAEQI